VNLAVARTETGAIAFAERLMGLLDQGAFTATYKYAVMLGLLDLCLEHASAKGVPPDSFTTRQLAEKVIALYWPHTVPYPGLKEARVLRQNAGGQAEILSAIVRFRDSLKDDPLAPMSRARGAAPERFERLVRTVEWKLIEMPLPRLQTAGAGAGGFVYAIGWDHGVKAADVRRYQRGEAGGFDNQIRLFPGVAEWLVQLHGVLRPLLHRHWAAMVARLNALEESRLERFLFGSERADLARARRVLLALQDGKCFYCRGSARSAADVDHFLPWSRYPSDAWENLVVADRGCNNAKRDFLASARHVAPWRARMEDQGFSEAGESISWERRAEATLGVARAIYLRLPEGMGLWDGGERFVAAEPTGLGTALS
jgi:5-methylcytosine-specific restriction endonuclease McrA